MTIKTFTFRFKYSKSIEREQSQCEPFSTPGDTHRKSSQALAMEKLECNVCNGSFKTKRILKLHMERKDCEKVHSCDDCGKKSKFSLENHKNYCPAKSYECDICQKSFKNRNMLEHHQVRHANKKEFECNECGKRFNIKSDLNVHQRIHIGEKNFHCKDCGKSFLGSSQLKNHQYVHSEAREFLCHCGKGFKTSYALKKTFHCSQRCKEL